MKMTKVRSAQMTSALRFGAGLVLWLALAIPGSAWGQYQLNEIRIDEPGVDNNEYVEITGPAGTNTPANLSLVVLGEGAGGTGEIEAIVDLSGITFDADGFAVVAEATFELGTAEKTTNLNFENLDTLTFFLVSDLTGSEGDDLDVNDDGTLDSTPWNLTYDSVAVVEQMGEELPYSATQVTTAEMFGAPLHVQRCPDGGTWEEANADETDPGDTPGSANQCGCADGFYGAGCTDECPGGAANPCNGNGTCDDGELGLGGCTCNMGFDGAACDECAAGRFGATCTPCPGGADTPCNNNGTCDDGIGGLGACTCDAGFVTGGACDECQPGYFGADCTECPGGAANPCSGNGTCDDGIGGLGACTCVGDFAAPDCALVGGTVTFDLAIPAYEVSGDSASLTLSVTNDAAGPELTNLAMEITLPASLLYATDNGSCVVAGQTITCPVATLSAGATATADILVVVNAAADTNVPLIATVIGDFTAVGGNTTDDEILSVVQPEDCANGVDDNGVDGADCADPACSADAFCTPCSVDVTLSTGDAGWTAEGSVWSYTVSAGDGMWATGGTGAVPAGPAVLDRLQATVDVPSVADGGPAPALEVVYRLLDSDATFAVCVNQTTCDGDNANGFSTSTSSQSGLAPDGANSFNDGVYDHIFVDLTAFAGQSVDITFAYDSDGPDGTQDGVRLTQVTLASDVDVDGLREGSDALCDPCWDGDFDTYVHPLSPGLGVSCGPTEADCDDTNASVSPAAVEICNQAGDEDCDGLINGFDPDCGPEDCANGIDDNGDDQADCDDALCNADPACNTCGQQLTFDSGPNGFVPEDNDPDGNPAVEVWQHGQSTDFGGVTGWSTGRDANVAGLNTTGAVSVVATLTRTFDVPNGLPVAELEIVYALDGDGGPGTDVFGVCFDAQSSQCNASAPPNLLAWTTSTNTAGLETVRIPVPAGVANGGSLVVVLFYDTVDNTDNNNAGAFVDSVAVRSDLDQDGLYERIGVSGCDSCIDADNDGYPPVVPFEELALGCPQSELDCDDNAIGTNPGVVEDCSLAGDQDCDGLIDDDEVVCSVCGDGLITAGEQCDDGNQQANDGCDSGCQLEPNALMLTEIHVSKLNGGDGEQWLEFVNRTDSPLDLTRAGLSLSAGGNTLDLPGTCVVANDTIAAGAYVVVALGDPSETDGLAFDVACDTGLDLSAAGDVITLSAGLTAVDSVDTTGFACALAQATANGVGRSVMLASQAHLDAADNDAAERWCLPTLALSYANSGDHYGSPGALGTCGEAACDLVDDDCNGLIDDGLPDADVDGFCDEVDCDDSAPTCALDCATDVDFDTVADCRDGCIDADGDGYGVSGGLPDNLCATEGGEPAPDCNDALDFVNPGAAEVPGNGSCSNGLDENCDGLPDCADDACGAAGECAAEACGGQQALACGDVVEFEPATNAFTCGSGADAAYSFVAPTAGLVEFEVESLGTGQFGVFQLNAGCVNLACDSGANATSSCAEAAVLALNLAESESVDLVVDRVGTCSGVGSATLSLTVRCTEVCDSGVDEDADGTTDCDDSDCVSDAACANADFDQDGVSNGLEITCASNPTDILVFPSADDIANPDGDLQVNCVDADDDDDGTDDSVELAQCVLNPEAKNVATIAPGNPKVCDQVGIDADCNGTFDTAEDACGAVEVQCIDGEDNDSDGLSDCDDPDCVPTSFCSLADFDNDLVSNGIELQCNTDPLDGAETPTAAQAADPDGDGLANCADTDDDGDNASDLEELLCGSDPLSNVSVPLDTDSDGQCNAADSDDDNDGFLDVVEADCNSDSLDENSTPVDPAHDLDGDGTCDALDLDMDGDGWDNSVEDTCGTFFNDPLQSPTTAGLDDDGDMICDALDTDDDNDGWEDDQEILCQTDPKNAASSPADQDDDGVCDLFDEDTDGDDWPDELEVQCGTLPLDPASNPTAFGQDADNDKLCDKVDADDDGDGWSDEAEESCGTDPADPSDTPTDTDGDQLCNALDDDDDDDGFADTAETFCSSDPLDATSEPVDTDGDGLCDATDPDADFDEDGWNNSEEQACGTDPTDVLDVPADPDGDGVCSALDPDKDGDGWNNAEEIECGSDPDAALVTPADTDDNGVCDVIDTDDDGDGAPDTDEILCGTDPLSADSKTTQNMLANPDGDELVNCVDDDDDNDGLLDTIEEAVGTDREDVDTDGDGLEDGQEDADLDGEVDPTETSPLLADTDDDGLEDGVEAGSCYLGGDAEACQQSFGFDADSDDDDVPDGLEDANGNGLVDDGETNPLVADSDADTVSDGEELLCKSDPLDSDSVPEDLDGNGTCDGAQEDIDGDGVSDGVEQLCGTDPLDSASVPDLDDLVDADDDGLLNCADPDDDQDGVDDVDELECGSDPDDPASTATTAEIADTDGDGALDCSDDDDDNDGLDDATEALLETDPLDQDTDDDGLSDGQEVTLTATDPTDADTDGDGLQDGTELGETEGTPDTGETFIPDADPTTTTNPKAADTDGDTVIDGDEDINKNGRLDDNELDPNLPADGLQDRDGDGLTDLEEIELGTDPGKVDTDGDQLDDKLEVSVWSTDPLNPDTDGGGVEDGIEVAQGTDPKLETDDYSAAEVGGDTVFGCSGTGALDSSHHGANLGFLLVALMFGLVWRRRRSAALGAMVLLMAVPSARAQNTGVNIENFQPSGGRYRVFSVEQSQTGARWQPYAHILFHGERQSLQVRNGRFQETLIDSHTFVDVNLGIGLWDFLQLDVSLPVALQMDSGNTVSVVPQSGAGLGDLVVRLRGTLLNNRSGGFGIGLSAGVTAPIGDGDRYRGDPGVGILANAIFDVRLRRVVLALNAGVRIRTEEARLLTATFGNELTYGLGMDVALWLNRIDLGVEVFGRTPLNEPFASTNSTTVEVLAGPKWWIIDGLVLQAGVGAGLVQGYGAPDFRFIAGLAWAPRHEDGDGDGVPDNEDDCPLSPEDRDGYADDDGCPEVDNDNDGKLDDEDKCPNEPEDLNGLEDDDGCPDGDQDGDGISDATDQCPLDREDVDGFADDDGCPDLDNDGDGIADAEDKCPLKPELYNGIEDEDGCPGDAPQPGDPKTVVVEKVERVGGCRESWPDIRFVKGRADLTAAAKASLRKLAAALASRPASAPKVEKVWVSGHASVEGTDEQNYRLSQRRADTARAFLLGEGVSGRLVGARAFGESAPAQDRAGTESRKRNRRVSFELALGAGCKDAP